MRRYKKKFIILARFLLVFSIFNIIIFNIYFYWQSHRTKLQHKNQFQNALYKSIKMISSASRYEKNHKSIEILRTIARNITGITQPVISSIIYDSNTKTAEKLFNQVQQSTIVVHANFTFLETNKDIVLTTLESYQLSSLIVIVNQCTKTTNNMQLLQSMRSKSKRLKFFCTKTLDIGFVERISWNVVSEYLIVVPQSWFLALKHISKLAYRFIAPLIHFQVDAMGLAFTGSINDDFQMNCYQMRTLRYQHHIIKGYDVLDAQGNMLCDYVGGAFSITKALWMSYLQQTLDGLAFDHYIDLFQYLKQQGKIVKAFVDNKITDNTLAINWKSLRKENIKPFMTRNSLNTFIFPSGTMEFSCDEVKITKGEDGLMIPKCIIDELHVMFIRSIKYFEKNGFEYDLDAGTTVGAAKLLDTLYWEKDHDLQFRSKYIRPLTDNFDELSRFGYKYVTDRMDNYEQCLKELPTYCGYCSINSKNWFIELWGQNKLSSDFLTNKSSLYPHKSRFVHNNTLGEMRGDAVRTNPNPGVYSRSHYGLNVLKHAKHWSDKGLENSWKPYHPGKWKKCELPGHHACFDNFLCDGNRQYRWIEED